MPHPMTLLEFEIEEHEANALLEVTLQSAALRVALVMLDGAVRSTHGRGSPPLEPESRCNPTPVPLRSLERAQ